MYNIYFNKNSVLAQLKLFRVNSISTIVNVSIFLYYWFKFYRYDDVCLIMITFMEFQLDQEAISALGRQLNYSAICGKKYQLTFINTQFLSLLLLFFFLGLLSLLMKFYIIQKKNTLQRKSLVSESSKRQFKDHRGASSSSDQGHTLSLPILFVPFLFCIVEYRMND